MVEGIGETQEWKPDEKGSRSEIDAEHGNANLRIAEDNHDQGRDQDGKRAREKRRPHCLGEEAHGPSRTRDATDWSAIS